MRAFKIWTQQKFSFRHNGELFEGEVFGGSNDSLAEARSDAVRRWEAVCQRITGALPRRSADYEADIREEVLRSVGPSAVLTRNRYGAEVLNCPETVILDIDRPPKGFLDFFRRPGSVEQIRERIVLHIKASVESRRLGILGARIYHTPNGVRAILRTAVTDPRSREMRSLMKALKVDRLYALLSQRQGCYRARLTAKPSRIGLKSLGQKWPIADDAVAARADWVAQYTTACRRFAACRFDSAVGDAPSSPVIALHDELSGALGTLPLA